MSNQNIVSNVSDIIDEILYSEYGEHNLLVYPDKTTLRDIYCRYCKTVLENKNNSEIVLLIPYSETSYGVKYNLRNRASINVEKFENDGSLIIVDSLKNNFHSMNYGIYNVVLFVNHLLKDVDNDFAKKYISIISEKGSFLPFDDHEDLLDAEMFLPSRVDLNCKAFCCYHKDKVNTMLKHQRQKLLQHHFKNMILQPS